MKTASRFRLFLLSFAAGTCLIQVTPAWSGDALPPGRAIASPIRSYILPLSFEANQGQVDEQVRYLARGQGYTLFLTPSGAVLGLKKEGAGNSTEWVRLALQGATSTPKVTGEEKLPGQSHYLVGNDPAQWRAHIPNFRRVRYAQVYPGVDLIYYGREGQLENDFELAPGTDPNVISWRIEGADGLRVDSLGDLIVSVGGNELRLHQPRAYQVDRNEESEVPVRYRVKGQQVSFAVGNYNPQLQLVIDPVLTYSTYLGGSGGDNALGVAIDSSGEAYVTGITASANFPASLSSYQKTYAGGGDIFITKFNAAGNAVLFSTYLGGTGLDTPSQILLAPSSGNIFLVGSTMSNNFPTTGGAFQTAYDANQDAFLTEMKPDGSALVYSTYIGGSGTDVGAALTLDNAGDVFVVGSTHSTDFPTRNPLQLANDGNYDAFVAEISPTGALVYSTYLGGSQSDYGTGIFVDGQGNIYVSGYTFSSDFPTQNALQSALGGGSDLFLAKFRTDSSALVYSTYLGGSSIDRTSAMAVDALGNIYLTGDTQSPNFPVTANAFQSSLQGTDNAFLMEVMPNGSALVFSTYFGGGQTDQANAVALDSAGNIYITGFTQSSNFPLLDSFQNILGIAGAGTCGSTNLINVPNNTLCSDAFVAKFTPTGIPTYSSFLGGSGTDSGEGIATDSFGAAYVAGGTYSPNFPTTAGAYQWIFGGSSSFSNAFLTKVGSQEAASVSLTPQQINFGNQPIESTSNQITVTLTNEGSAALSITSITASGEFQQTNNCGTQVSAGGAFCTIQITFAPTRVGVQTNVIVITDNAGPQGATSTQSITVTGDGVLTGGSLLFSPTKLTFSSQTVNTTSANQTALLINNGNQAVTLTGITAPVGFAQTNNCGPNFPTVPASLNVGQTCTINVSFSPTATGSATGTLSVASNAVASPSLSLSGTGIADFALSSNQRSNVLPIGTKATTFTISATAPSSFLSSVVLSCSSGATCSFSPTSISAGQSSTLAITGLTATTANPLNITVTGTSGAQTTTLALTVFFSDYSLSATPSGTTVTAGNKATYTVTVTPTNGFNQTVLLSCPATNPEIPTGVTCYWAPPGLTFSGSNVPATSTLTMTTSTQSSVLRPPGKVPPAPGRWMLFLAFLTFGAAVMIGMRRSGPWLRPPVRLAVLLFAVLLLGLAAGCEDYVNPININPVVNGTPSGTFGITLTGTLGNSSGVIRTTNVNLSVLPSS